MNKQVFLLLAVLLYGTLAAFSQENRPGEVTVEFFVACNANGELDATNGTKITIEVTDNTGKTTTLTYTFPKGSHARSIAKYFADALKARGIDVAGVEYDDANRKARIRLRKVSRVRVGSSIDGKLHITFIYPPRPPGPRRDTVYTGKLPRLKKPPLPPKPWEMKPHKGPTTLPPHGPGSVQILVTMAGASGGQGGETTDTVTLSISATQGANSVDIKLGFPKKTPATKIAKAFHDTLTASGFDLKPYEDGDSQVFFNRVVKLDGAYSSQGARTTFGWGDTPIGIDDRGQVLKHYSIGLHYTPAFVEMAALNDYFDWINSTWGGDIAHLSTLHSGRAEVTYLTRQYIGVGLGFHFLQGSASGRSAGGAFRTELKVPGGYLRLLGEWSPGRGRFSLGAEGSAGYYSLRYTETEEQWKQTAKDAAPGFSAALQLGLGLGEHVRLVAGAGYQWLQFDDLGINWLSPGQPPAEIDMSGFNARAGLEFRF